MRPHWVDRGVGQRRRCVRVGQIGDARGNPVGSVGPLDLRDGVGEALGVDVGHEDAGTGIRERDRAGPADVAGCAGDDRDRFGGRAHLSAVVTTVIGRKC